MQRNHTIRLLRHRLSAALLVVALCAGLLAAQTQSASAKSPIIDSFLTVKSVKYSAPGGNPQAVVTMKVKREIPKGANIQLYWKYSLDSRDAGKYGTRDIYGKKGTRTYTLKLHKTVQVARVVLDLTVQQNYERKVSYQLVNPSTHYQRFTVSKKLAAANSLAMNAPGVALTVLPQTKVIKIAGAALLGWTVFSDVKESVTAGGKKCPKLKAGQFVEQKTYYAQSGKDTLVKSRTRMWSSKAAYNAAKTPICSVTGTVGSYR